MAYKECGTERVYDFGPKGVVGIPDAGLFSEKDWKALSNNSLVLMWGMNILQYNKEYPIIRYQPVNYDDSDASLNTFVKSVTVSTGVNGRCVSASGQLELTPSKYETVFYYEDSFGIYHSIVDDEVCKFMLQKPKLLVSSEGILLFYTMKEVLATIDCQHFSWLTTALVDVVCSYYSNNLLSDVIFRDIQVGYNYCRFSIIRRNCNNQNLLFPVKITFSFNIRISPPILFTAQVIGLVIIILISINC